MAQHSNAMKDLKENAFVKGHRRPSADCWCCWSVTTLHFSSARCLIYHKCHLPGPLTWKDDVLVVWASWVLTVEGLGLQGEGHHS